MQAYQIQTIIRDIDLDIQEITLLSKDEAEAFLSKEQRNLDEIWWLRSGHRHYVGFADEVWYTGSVSDRRVDVISGVAPALRISNLSANALRIGDTIKIGGESWQVISDDLAWCNHIIGKSSFRRDHRAPDAMVYEKSDVKQWLENWALERGICTTAQIEMMQGRA